jgi:hypothetical protein
MAAKTAFLLTSCQLRVSKDRSVYICPANKILTTTGKLVHDGETLLYRRKARDCRGCLL